MFVLTIELLENSMASNEKYCNVEYIGYGCTREPNHTGMHIAHTLDKKICAMWDNHCFYEIRDNTLNETHN